MYDLPVYKVLYIISILFNVAYVISRARLYYRVA